MTTPDYTDPQILAQSIALPDENAAELVELLHHLRLEYRPVGFAENRAIENMAVADWRRRRTWCMEMARVLHAARLQRESGDEFTAALQCEIPAMNSAIAVARLADSSRSLEFLRRLETGYSREYRYARAELKDLQKERLKREKEEKQFLLETADFIDPAELVPSAPEQQKMIGEPNLSPSPSPLARQPGDFTTQRNQLGPGLAVQAASPTRDTRYPGHSSASPCFSGKIGDSA